MEFKHAYDQIILSELKEKSNRTFGQIYKRLSWVYPGISIGDSTVADHLKRWVEAGLVVKGDKGRYSLTPATKVEFELFGSIEPVKSRREPRSPNESDEDKDKNKKACLVFVLQAIGTQRIKIVNEPVPHLVIYKQAGVTTKEILEHTDIAQGGLFRHVNLVFRLITQ